MARAPTSRPLKKKTRARALRSDPRLGGRPRREGGCHARGCRRRLLAFSRAPGLRHARTWGRGSVRSSTRRSMAARAARGVNLNAREWTSQDADTRNFLGPGAAGRCMSRLRHSGRRVADTDGAPSRCRTRPRASLFPGRRTSSSPRVFPRRTPRPPAVGTRPNPSRPHPRTPSSIPGGRDARRHSSWTRAA